MPVAFTGNKFSWNVSTTPNTAMGCRQCLLLSVVQLKGKHCRKPQCRNGVVDMFGQRLLNPHLTKTLSTNCPSWPPLEKKYAQGRHYKASGVSIVSKFVNLQQVFHSFPKFGMDKVIYLPFFFHETSLLN